MCCCCCCVLLYGVGKFVFFVLEIFMIVMFCLIGCSSFYFICVLCMLVLELGVDCVF